MIKETLSFQPVLVFLAHAFGKGLRDPDEELLVIMNSMGKDVLGGIPSVCQKNYFFFRVHFCPFVKNSAEGGFLVHLVDSLDFKIIEGIIKWVIQKVQVYLVDASASLNTLDVSEWIGGIISKV